MDKSQKASLGCGTIILIALIVLIFGNMGGKDAAEQVRSLRNDVQRLEKTVSAQTRQIETLERTMIRLLGTTSRPAKTTQPEQMPESR